MNKQGVVVLSDGSDDEIVCVHSRPPATAVLRTRSMTAIRVMELSDQPSSERSDEAGDLDVALARFDSKTTTACASTTDILPTAGPSHTVVTRKRKAQPLRSFPSVLSPVRERPVKTLRSVLVTVDGNQQHAMTDIEQDQPSEESDDETPEAKAARKEAEKEERRPAREAAKEAEKVQKKYDRDAAKAAREAEKSNQKKLAEANRLRVSKIDALREIELHMAYDLSLPSSPIAGAMPEVKLRLDDSLSTLHFLTQEETVAEGTIRFLRRVKAVWDPEEKHFTPLAEERIEWEPTLVVVTSVDGIVDRIAESDDMFMEWVSDIRLAVATTPKEQVFLLVRGLAKYHSKSVSLVNQNYRDKVSARLHEGAMSAEGGRTSRRVTKEMVEAELLRAQVEKHVYVVLVDETEEIEDWLFNLAGDVAVRPYKRLTKSHLAFSAPDGQRKGAEPNEVLELMLQEVPGVTSSAALGVTRCYPSLRRLMEAYDEIEEEEGETLLEGCAVGTLATGVVTSRQLGQALSKKVHEILRGDDPLALL